MGTRLATVAVLTGLVIAQPGTASEPDVKDSARWQVGTSIATYWAGPRITDAVAEQMVECGFNVVWCRSEEELDLAHKHGLRGMFVLGGSRQKVDSSSGRKELEALIDRISKHPALYCYYIVDEPGAAEFPSLGKVVEFLREHDPSHMAHINLFPTYANNQQLGTSGDTVTAYRKYLKQYVEVVKPQIISYDHYHFYGGKSADGKQLPDRDGNQYFLNLSLIRRAAQGADVPFLNIVQACSWTPGIRVPDPGEMRYQVYTTVAYGAQGISYYVYRHRGHVGGIASQDGTLTPIGHALKSLNREFVAIASEVQHLRSQAIYHTALEEPGCHPLPEDAAFRIAPSSAPGKGRGFLLGYFGKGGQPTHAVVVNLNHDAEATATVVGPANLEVFNATTRKWSAVNDSKVELHLPAGGGRLVRIE